MTLQRRLWVWCRVLNRQLVVSDAAGGLHAVSGPLCCIDGRGAIGGTVVGEAAGVLRVRFSCGTVLPVVVESPRQWESAA